MSSSSSSSSAAGASSVQLAKVPTTNDEAPTPSPSPASQDPEGNSSASDPPPSAKTIFTPTFTPPRSTQNSDTSSVALSTADKPVPAPSPVPSIPHDSSFIPQTNIVVAGSSTTASAVASSNVAFPGNTVAPTASASLSQMFVLTIDASAIPATSLATDSIAFAPSTFSIIRRPTPSSTFVLTPPSLSDAPKPYVSGASKRSHASGLITGIVLAILFLILALFVLRPQWTRKREAKPVEDADDTIWKDSSTSTLSEDSMEKKLDVNEMVSEDDHEDKAYMVQLPIGNAPTFPGPPPPAPHSTPPLSGLYSPTAWATLLATPESRKAASPRLHRPVQASPHSTYSLGGQLPLSNSRSATPAGFEGRRSPSHAPSSIRADFYEDDSSSVYSTQTYQIASPKLGVGGGVFGRAGMGTERMQQGMLLPVALVGAGATTQESFPTTPNSDCGERF